MARAIEHQAALLLGRLGLDKPHVGPSDRLADGFSVGSIILLPLDVRCHRGRRHQTHSMAKRLEFTRPMCDEAQASMPTRHGCSFYEE